jgi:hypothetical protein
MIPGQFPARAATPRPNRMIEERHNAERCRRRHERQAGN